MVCQCRFLSLSVQDAMIREIVSIEPRKTTEEAVCLMVEHGISSLIVASDGILPWILMEKDVLTRVVARG